MYIYVLYFSITQILVTEQYQKIIMQTSLNYYL